MWGKKCRVIVFSLISSILMHFRQLTINSSNRSLRHNIVHFLHFTTVYSDIYCERMGCERFRVIVFSKRVWSISSNFFYFSVLLKVVNLMRLFIIYCIAFVFYGETFVYLNGDKTVLCRGESVFICTSADKRVSAVIYKIISFTCNCLFIVCFCHLLQNVLLPIHFLKQ